MKQTLHQTESELICALAEKLSDPDQVKVKVIDKNNKNPKPFRSIIYWNDLSIAGGYPGVLPLFIELNRLYPNEKWELIIHKYIIKIKQAIELYGISNISMFGGLAGVCFFIQEASNEGTRYKKILDKLNTYLIEKIEQSYLNNFDHYLGQNNQSVPPRLYETIQGLSGIGAYCIRNLSHPAFSYLTEKIIQLLIQLTQSIEIKNTLIPRWHVSQEALFLEEEQLKYPKGVFNLGLSHGITGVLAFLSIALKQRIEQKGQKEAIKTIASWLIERRRKVSNRFYWDTHISFEDEAARHLGTKLKSKDAWCYGTPGVARSLYLAGQALHDHELQQIALESFSSIFNSSQKEWGLLGPTFCHGISGLLMITYLMAKDSHSSYLFSQVAKLKKILLSFYDPQAPFGFKHYEPMINHRIAQIDRVDLLEGTPGVLLTLLSLNSDNYSWHLPFLIE